MGNLIDKLKKKKIIFLFPHPDDESYSCSVLIKKLLKHNNNLYLIYLSSGVPVRSEYYPPLKDLYKYENYKKLRKTEFTKAIQIIGIKSSHVITLNYPARRAVAYMRKTYMRLKEEIKSKDIDVIFSCSYEGGHPDHDVVSYLASCLEASNKKLESLEYSGYFSKGKSFVSGHFMRDFKTKRYKLNLDKEGKKLKDEILSRYSTQSIILKNFSREAPETFRIKPNYSYNELPSDRIFYESWQKTFKAEDLLKYLVKIPA